MPKFKTLIIDPPWPYEAASKNKKLTGYVTQEGNNQYKTLTIDDLKALPISDVMDETEAYLFLWATSPFLPDAFKLIEAWKFKYVTTLCWYKNTGLGVGFWFRGSHELVLVAKREKAASIRTGEQSIFTTIEDGVFESKRSRHSAKPDILYELIEKQRPAYEAERTYKDRVVTQVTPATFPGPYLEIFARRYRDGWTSLGNEVPNVYDQMDISESLPKLIAKVTNEVADEPVL